MAGDKLRLRIYGVSDRIYVADVTEEDLHHPDRIITARRFNHSQAFYVREIKADVYECTTKTYGKAAHAAPRREKIAEFCGPEGCNFRKC